MKRIWFIAIILLAGCGSNSTLPVTREVVPLPASSLTGVMVTGGVEVSWTASSTQGVSGYRVYRGTSPEMLSLIGVSENPTFTDTTIEPGNTYYYSVTAVKANTESTQSDQLIWGT